MNYAHKNYLLEFFLLYFVVDDVILFYYLNESSKFSQNLDHPLVVES
jgi:hypothetical protein